MNSSDEIKKLVKNIRLTPEATANERILKHAAAALKDSANKPKPDRLKPNIWRIIMNKPITKLTTAAAIILIVVLAITFLDKSATPAWAIEDAIELLTGFNGLQFKGILLDEQGKEVNFEAWARANEDQTASNHLRIETEAGAIDVVSGDRRYQYDPATQTVKITESYGPAIRPWPGADFFKVLKNVALDWNETYGRDPATDRDRVFITCSHPASSGPRSWWFEFDVESRLPVSMKQWENTARQGTPAFNIKSLTFIETLPDELFEFEIPEEAKVVPALAERNNKLQDPDSGMLFGTMTKDQACVEITRRYWQAVIEEDWQTVATLCPTSTAEQWQNKYSGSNLEEIVEIKEPRHVDGYAIVPCKIRFDGNATRPINTSVMFRTIDGQQSCVIVNTWMQDWD